MKTLKKQKALRPTTGKVREALFNILRGKIKNSSFLDLYAGTGAVGIDALRAGAAEVFFVEENKSNTRKIAELVQKKSTSGEATIVAKKAMSFIDGAGLRGTSFDIIFLDPPYHSDEIMHILAAIGTSHIIHHRGIVVAEHFKKRSLPDKIDRLRKIKDYLYGDSILTVYEAD